MKINDLLIKIDKLNEEIDKEHQKALKRKLIIADEIKNLEDERKKAGFKGDFFSVEKYNLEIKRLNQKMNENHSYKLKQEINSLKIEITNIIIDYYKSGKSIIEIFEIENVSQDIQNKWIKSSNFGKFTGYLFVDFIKKGNENNWKYYNPITEVNLESRKLSILESKLESYGEILFVFDGNLAKQSKNRDLQLNNPDSNNLNVIRSSSKKNSKNNKSNTKKKLKLSKPKKNISGTKKKPESKNNLNKPPKPKSRLSNLVNKKLDVNHEYKENYAIILDYLPRGYLNSTMTKFGGKPIAQAIGIDKFTFLELAPKNGIFLEIGEVVYIGKGKRDKIYRVLGTINLESLTRDSILELDDALDEIVEAHEQRYVHYFNTAGSISLKLHGLGLLPGINGRMVENILKQRERKKFKSFEDIKERVPLVKNPQKNVVNKIKEELKLIPQKKKHRIRIFTPIPKDTKKKKKRR